MKQYLSKNIFGERRIGFLIFIAVFVWAMVFAAYTNHAWEDYYITYRVSKNLATGNGLVYTIGEKVHAFTSPLNTLVPAVLIIITGNTSDQLVLWLFRVICCLLLAGAALLLYKAARKNSLSLIPIAVLIGMFALDTKIIDFSINGQEIAFMMFFLALVLYALTTPGRQTYLKLGLGLAGLMWTRPDGFIYFGALAVGFLLFGAGQQIGYSRRGLLKVFFYAGIIAIILYLPWFLWAWSYFGSPIPHTILAKGYTSRGYTSLASIDILYHIFNFITFPFWILFSDSSVKLTFLPIYATPFGGWIYPVYIFSYYLSYICALYWCLPFGNPQARAVSFAFFISNFYLTYIAAYSAQWYIPSCGIMGIFVIAHILNQLLNLSTLLKIKDTLNARHLVNFVRVSAVTILAVTLTLIVCSAYELRIQQKVIEEGNRKKIGLWLRDHADSPSDSVFLEPLGYIGYFSQLKMLDYPGLCAPEIVAAQKKLSSSDWAKLIRELRPKWLVLRPDESQTIYKSDFPLTRQYLQYQVFDVSRQIDSYTWLPGRGYFRRDQIFKIFKIRPDADFNNTDPNLTNKS